MEQKQYSYGEKKDYSIIVQAAAKEATPLTRMEIELIDQKNPLLTKEDMFEKWKYWLDKIIEHYARKMEDIEGFYDTKLQEQEKRHEAAMEELDIDEELPEINI